MDFALLLDGRERRTAQVCRHAHRPRRERHRPLLPLAALARAAEPVVVARDVLGAPLVGGDLAVALAEELREV